MLKRSSWLLLLVLLTVCTVVSAGVLVSQTKLPPGYWPLQKSQPIIERTQTIRLAPNLSHLTGGERTAVAKLLEVGRIFQKLYEDQRHPQALSAYAALEKLDRRTPSAASTNLLTLYRLFQGPVATTLDNKRETFLPVAPGSPAKNVYPPDATREEIESYLSGHPRERDEILDLRTVVRRRSAQNIQDDLTAIREYPVLDTLHPGLKKKLMDLSEAHHQSPKRGRANTETPARSSNPAFYAVPYAVAYADELTEAFALLNEAANAVAPDDEEFARFLRNRARDLLSNDYESGDASWITGHFKNLNAQIGSYESYDDELFGVKTFFALSVLSVRQKETSALRKAMQGLQVLEESLPYRNHKKIREDIPVGVYDVVADFGQARGGNTATILPNESYLARRYGRTILLRANIMREPEIFTGTARNYLAAVGPDQAKELSADGNFYRTLWHEVGHYLGVDRTKDGRDLDEALQDSSNTLEEMKADLVSLFVAEALRRQGYYTEAQLRSVYGSGILRVLQNNKPRPDQPYNTMQLMQWNFFLEKGLLTFENDILRIHHDKYHQVVGELLEKVLELQYQGDKAAAERFISAYTTWDENLHGKVARNIREQQRYRFRLFRYAALGE